MRELAIVIALVLLAACGGTGDDEPREQLPQDQKQIRETK